MTGQVDHQGAIHPPHVKRLVLLCIFAVVGPLYSWSFLTVGGLPVGQADLVAATLVVIAGIAFVLRRGHFVVTQELGILWIFLLHTTVVSCIGLVLDPSRLGDILTMYAQLVIIGAFVTVIANLDLSVDDVLFTLRVWVVTAAALVVFGFYQTVARVLGLPLTQLVFNYPGNFVVQRIGYDYPVFLRVASVFAEPSWYGAYLVVPCTILVVALVYDFGEPTLFHSRRVELGVTAILFLGVFQSGSMLAYISLTVTLTAYVLGLGVFRGTLPVVPVLGGAGCGFLVPYLLFEQARELLSQIVILPLRFLRFLFTFDPSVLVTTGSTGIRLHIVLLTIDAWRSLSPWRQVVGAGLNTLESDSSIMYTASTGAYSQILLDQGLIGVLLFVALFAVLFKHLLVSGLTIDGRSSESGDEGFLALALGGAVFVTAVQLLQIGYVRPVRWFGISLALAALIALPDPANT